MKKLFLSLAFMLVANFTFASFSMGNKVKSEAKEVITWYRVYYHCTDGSGGGSFLINDLSEAQSVANFLCS